MLIVVLLFIIVVLLVIITSLNLIVDYMLLFPSRNTPSIPSDDRGGGREVRIPVGGQHLHGWLFDWFPPERYPEAKYIIYCHGNAGHVGHRRFIVDICRRVNCNLLLFDYRGFGKSSGEAKLEYLIPDVEAVFQWLTQRVNSRQVIVWGESMGGSVATWLAAHHDLGGLILMATFRSLPAVINDHLGLAGTLISYIVPKLRRYPVSEQLIGRVKSPITIMHSLTDEVIPHHHAVALQDAIQHHQQQRMVIRGAHAQPIIDQHQLKQLFAFYGLNYYHLDQIYQDYQEVLK